MVVNLRFCRSDVSTGFGGLNRFTAVSRGYTNRGEELPGDAPLKNGNLSYLR